MFVVQVVVALLNARADANAVDSDGWTALMFAACDGHYKVRGGAHSGERGGFKSTHTQHAPGGDEAEGVWGGGGLVVTPPELRGRAHGRGFTFGGRRLRGQLGGGSLWESPLKVEMTTLHQRRSCSPVNALPSAVLNV